MILDKDLIRSILLWCEDKSPDETHRYQASEINIPGYKSEQIIDHLAFLAEGGYLVVQDFRIDDKTNYLIRGLSYYGHQYLEAIKSNTVETNTKKQQKK
jgi:hypothetical protein